MSADAGIFFANGSKISEGLVDAGGDKGIALTCAVGYEFKWEAGELYLTDLSGNYIDVKDYARTIPLENDDITKGFTGGSYWITITGQIYQCQDATEGAAVWVSAEDYGNLQIVTDNGNTTTNTIRINPGGNPGLVILDADEITGINANTSGISITGGSGQSMTITPTDFTFTKENAEPGFKILSKGAATNATSSVQFDLPDKVDATYTLATTVDLPTKTSDLINDGDNGTSHFISLEDLPSTLTLYPTTATSSIGGYNKLVSSITDPSYNTTAVDVSTGAITGTDQLIAGLITEPNQIIGNPGVFNITTIGNIRKTAGSGQAEFYFTVYKRDAGGTETLILQSSNTPQITSAIYTEFNASGLWNDGIFVSTDRIVLKFYGTKVGSGSNPTYDFQFGGTAPVRSIVPVPLNVIPVLSLDELTDVEITSPTNNQIPAYESATEIWQNKNILDLVEDFNRTQGIYYFEEFMGQLNANVSTSVNSIHNAVNNGQGTTRSTTSITNKTIQQGVIESLTNANSTGTAGFGYGSGQYKGSGSITMETYFNITTLSTLAERFFTIFGWITGSNLSNPANAILITYDEGGVVIPYAGGTPNFRCITRGGSTITNTISSVPVVAGQWYKLKINISSDGGTVTFFIDDTLVATHSTNLPLNTTAILPYSIIAKSSGTAARAMQTDYFMYKQIFTTPR